MISILRVIFLLLWSGVIIFSSLVVMILTFNRKTPVIMARTVWSPGIIWGSGMKDIIVKGLENIDKDKSYIFVSNHQSLLDIPSIIYTVPVNFYFIVKKEIKKTPLLGWYVSGTGMIFIDRKNKKKAIESLHRAGKLITNGKSVLAFPEGTRSEDGKLIKFKKGLFMLAIQHGIEVVPIAVDGTHRVLPSNSWKFTPQQVIVNVGKPIRPPQDEKEVDKFVEEVKGSIGGMMGN